MNDADNIVKQATAGTRKKMQQAIDTEFFNRQDPNKVRCPSLKKMAQYVNTLHSPKYSATVEVTEDTKDRSIAGSRLRHPGQTYHGNGIIIKDEKGAEILNHNSCETYRKNVDVAQFILKHLNNKIWSSWEI